MSVHPIARNRIQELRFVRADTLIPHEKNWRTHPKGQRDALEGILAEVGYADALLARETPEGLVLIDGHLRAETTPDQDVPVLVLDVTEAEADLLLASLDPLAAMGGVAGDKLAELLERLRPQSESLQAMLDDLASDGILTVPAELDAPQSQARQAVAHWLVAIDDVPLIEEAMRTAGGVKRGDALAEICRRYLGQG